MKQFTLDEKTKQDLLNYLASKPFIEVFQLINSLQSTQEIPTLKQTAPTLVVDKNEEKKDSAQG